nr:hypothetical protein [Alphaproteobacteria bacterium]
LSPPSQIIRDSWQKLLAQNLPVIITTNPNLPEEDLNAIADWINRGGKLIRFANTTSHLPSDNLLPSEIIQIIHSNPAYFLNADAARLWDIPADSPLYKMAHPLRDSFNTYWLMSPQLRPQTEIWASYNNGAPMIAARRIGNGLSIFVTAAPVPTSGKWMTSIAFPELMHRLVSTSSPPKNDPAREMIDFESLALLHPDTLPSSINISDLGIMAQNINLKPYLLALALLLFVVDQLLILLRFSGILWTRS